MPLLFRRGVAQHELRRIIFAVNDVGQVEAADELDDVGAGQVEDQHVMALQDRRDGVEVAPDPPLEADRQFGRRPSLAIDGIMSSTTA